MTSIYSGLLYLVNLLNKIYCPTCEMRDFGKNGTYKRDEEMPLLPITIEWKVQRYYCKTCPSSNFSSFTNTIFHNKEKHPVFFLLSRIFLALPYNSKLTTFLQQIQWNMIGGTDELTFSVDMTQNHQSDDFVQDIRYFLQECLDEKQRRLFAGVLSKLFNNITTTHQITGMARKTVRRGSIEISDRLKMNHIDQPIRGPGAGRPSILHEYEELVIDCVKPYTAGDPMSSVKWMRKSLRNIARKIDYVISHVSIGKILRSHNYRLGRNLKTIRTRDKHPKRGEQFEFINKSLNEYNKLGVPVIAIDGKKSESIGAFRQDGRTWVKIGKEYEVFDHDYTHLRIGKMNPFGIYDAQLNEAFIVAGTSIETTEFAVDSLVIWWEKKGRYTYPKANELCITCDAGRPNTYRGYLFKYLMQTKFVDKFGLTVNIMHYPPGDSKYHIIERACFCHISHSFRGEPLTSFEKAICLMKDTTTKQGLTVDAILHEKEYQRGLAKEFSKTDYETINLTKADINPEFNYTIHPRKKDETLRTRIIAEQKEIERQIKKFSNKPFVLKERGINDAHKLANSEWIYHSLSGTEVTNKPKRADGEVGRPPKGCKMIDQFHIEIKYEVSETYRRYMYN